MLTVVPLAAGAGGRAMRALVEQVFLQGAPADTPDRVGLASLDDGAALRLGDQWLIVTTDSYVVSPTFFAGGDVGRLAVCGTVNDLAMMGGTQVLGLTCAVVLEEGYPVADLQRLYASMQQACAEAGVAIVTGDTKVMRRGELDGIVITTAGVALAQQLVRDNGLQIDDYIVVTGTVGDHGLTIAATRAGLELDGDLRSDAAPLRELVQVALQAGGGGITAMKDPTRGGVASALHEMASKAGVGIRLQESAIPLHPAVRAAGELMGIDPLHAACEGRALLGVQPGALEPVLAALRSHPLGRAAATIGRVVSDPKSWVILDTGVGRRIVSEPEGEPLPRIC